jgi:SH3-like domain-containing protein
MERSVAFLLLIVGILLMPSPANAATETVYDPYNRSAPAQNLKYARFSYNERSVVVRIKMEHLSKKRTVLVSKYLRRDGTTIQVVTKYVRGDKRVLVSGYDEPDVESTPVDLADAAWDFRRDIVRIWIGEELLQGKRASFLAWSQEKGAMHGNPFGDAAYAADLEQG